MRSRMPRMHRALVHRNAGPGQPLHERHRRAAIDVRPVPALFFEDREDTRWRRMPRNARGYQPARILAVGIVEGHMLFGERHNRKQGTGRLFEFSLGLALPFLALVPVIVMPVLPGASGVEGVGRHREREKRGGKRPSEAEPEALDAPAFLQKCEVAHDVDIISEVAGMPSLYRRSYPQREKEQ